MSRDLPCLDSTPVDSPKRLQSLPQHPYSSPLNRVFTYVAQEVAELLEQSDHFPVNGDNNPVETIAIRAICASLRDATRTQQRFAIAPEYKLSITLDPLTERELEVLQLITDGHNNNAIAQKLYITVGTVKTHVRNILRKLCVSDRTQAAIQALRSGLVH